MAAPLRCNPFDSSRDARATACGDWCLPCPEANDYCAELLDQFTEREALEEALKP